MGASTGINYRTMREVYNCGNCGTADGTVRRVACPRGWCPRSQLCPGCLKELRRDGRWAEAHRYCGEHLAAYERGEAAKNAAGDEWAKAAWGTWHTGTDDVLVLTRSGSWFLVPHESYNASSPLSGQGARRWTAASGVALPPGCDEPV